jgi:hypothetical protein
MEEGCPTGRANRTSQTQVSPRGGLRSSRGSSRPHSEIFTDSVEVGTEGARGWREQCGPVQGQGWLGIRVSDLGAVELFSGKPAGVRSM